MPTNRAATLRSAQKLLRLGKLEQAISAYVRLVEDQPGDRNSATVLGDLYVRTGQLDKAIEQFIRVADGLRNSGFPAKASAFYKKVLKIKPDAAYAQLQAAEIAASEGQVADARRLFESLAERWRLRGDRRGAAELLVRVGSLDPDDLDARRAGARARVDLDDVPGAVRELREIADAQAERGRPAEAVETLREARAIQPADSDLSARLLELYVAAGDPSGAREYAVTAEQFKKIAAMFDGVDRPEEALGMLCEAARLDPLDGPLRMQIVHTMIGSGNVVGAAEYLAMGTAEDRVALRIEPAVVRLCGEEIQERLASLRQLVENDSDKRQGVACLGWAMAAEAPALGLPLVDLAVDAAVEAADYGAAAAALQEFVSRVPGHIPSLLRLVEVCVDGGLEGMMQSAQVQLADSYVAAGSAKEAYVIAEELLAQEPGNRAHVERFRQVLVLLGESNPGAVMSERLGAGISEHPSRTAEAGARNPGSIPSGFDTSSTVDSRWEGTEVDLSEMLDDISPSEEPLAVPASDASPSIDLEDVFARLREASSITHGEAEEQYRRGVALHEAGEIDGCIPLLQAAARAPLMRFLAARRLGRVYRQLGSAASAIEWFERAAEAPPPSVGDGHFLLYELADILESAGECARALAVCMELRTDAGDYRDVAERIDRLANIQEQG